MPLWQAGLFFAIPALVFRVALYVGLPALLRLGLTGFEAATVAITVPAALLFAFALGFPQMEGRGVTWEGMKARFRLRRMTRRDWLWTAAGFVAAFLLTGALSPTAMMLRGAVPAIAPPQSFPAFLDSTVTSNPAALSRALADSVAAPMLGNWGVVILMAITLFFNIVGEELWWRGLILPRQELALGRHAWLIHGLLWLLFHMPIYPWRLFDLLPYCLIISFVAQRRGNTWPAIIIHCQNGLVLLATVAMVLGLA